MIGAKKAGTTSLYHYLDAHPQVAMSREKELDFFVAERNWRRGVGWYERRFDGRMPVRGEASPYYTALPAHAGVPERMVAVVPDVRLVYLVRDPIERLLSHFHMALATGRERRQLGEAVTDAAASWYVAQGRYWTQLEAYLRHFDSGQVLVVDQHELLLHRRAALRRVFAFAGVDVDFDAPDFDEVHFPSLDRRRRRPVAKAVLALGDALGNDRSYELRRRVPAAVHTMLSVPLERPAAEPALRERLEEIYAPEVERLREHTGLRFETWTV